MVRVSMLYVRGVYNYYTCFILKQCRFSLSMSINTGLQLHNYIDGEVRLYDSSFNGWLSQSIVYQICRVYADAAKEGNILVTVVPVQQQIGTSICGVMAIANGYHAVCGDSLAALKFNQDELRNHLVTCFENERFTPSQQPPESEEE